MGAEKQIYSHCSGLIHNYKKQVEERVKKLVNEIQSHYESELKGSNQVSKGSQGQIPILTEDKKQQTEILASSLPVFQTQKDEEVQGSKFTILSVITINPSKKTET